MVQFMRKLILKKKICVIIYPNFKMNGQIKNYYLYIDWYNNIMQYYFINTNYNSLILLLVYFFIILFISFAASHPLVHAC